jgi:thioesterase domain-containing protein
MSNRIQRLGALVDSSRSAKSANSDLTDTEQGTGKITEGAAQHGAGDGYTKVFLMPGIFNDNPTKLRSINASELLGLARLRYALREQIEFALIGYPDWREMIAAKGDFDAIVAFALEQILGQCGDGPIYIAGHSFGGCVAFATAHRLAEAGCRVAFLGLLDSRLPSVFDIPILGEYLENIALRLILRIPLELRAYVFLGALAGLKISIGEQRAHRHLLWVLRQYAVKRWQPKPLSVPTFFFRTEDNKQQQRYDCDWSGLCSRLTVVPIGGDHRSMLNPAHVNHVSASFLEALRAAAANTGFSSPIDCLSPSPVVSAHCANRDAERSPAVVRSRTGDPMPLPQATSSP